MEKLKILLIATMSLFCFPNILAQQNSTHNQEKRVVLKRNKDYNRPNSPSKYSIECTYGNGYMKFAFIGGTDNVYARIFDDERTVWDGYVSTTYSYVTLPDLSGVYQIECADELDNVFSGTLEFE